MYVSITRLVDKHVTQEFYLTLPNFQLQLHAQCHSQFRQVKAVETVEVILSLEVCLLGLTLG